MAPLPMPERADAADASRLVELSVRRGWPLASLRKAPFEDRHARFNSYYFGDAFVLVHLV